MKLPSLKQRGGIKAIQAVSLAKFRKVLPNLNNSIKCVDCGNMAKVYDHRDYGKPLEVQPVCYRCNALRGPAIPLTGQIEFNFKKSSKYTGHIDDAVYAKWVGHKTYWVNTGKGPCKRCFRDIYPHFCKFTYGIMLHSKYLINNK